MVRRYEDPVEVRRSQDGDLPASFLWRGRLYVVRDVLGHWQERRAWWASAAARAVHGEEPGADGGPPGGGSVGDGARTALAQEREVWRVEASRGRVHGSGVFDLCRDVVGSGTGGPGSRGDAWRLVRVAD
jgi:hypothetical protein